MSNINIRKLVDPISGEQFYPQTDINGLVNNGDSGVDEEPVADSSNLVTSGGVQKELALGAVYDVSAKNPTAGPNNDGKWESLSALLSDANLNTLIPTSVRKGGMSIKFVQSSDNMYVQARCMAQNFTTDATQWQGVDDEPTAGSDNLVKSGGVSKVTYTNIVSKYKIPNRLLLLDNTFRALDGWYVCNKVPVKEGDKIIYIKTTSDKLNVAASYAIITDTENNVLKQDNGDSGQSTIFSGFEYTMPSDGFVSLCGKDEDEISINQKLTSYISALEDYKVNTVNRNIILSSFRGIYKFGVIGDSLSVGMMTNPINDKVITRNLRFSWGQILARANGQVCLNFGFSGASATTWFTNTEFNCPSLLIAPENLCQVYIIGLGANPDDGGIGSIEDIDWENKDNNNPTFYGQYGRIIQLLREAAPKAIIFCLTLPYPREDINVNPAIRDICNDSHVSNYCYVVDLTDYHKLLVSDISKYYYNSHFTAPGYAMCAKMTEEAISKVMNDNADDAIIRSIGQIPFGNNDVIN